MAARCRIDETEWRGAGKPSCCGCVVVKKKHHSKQQSYIYQTTNSWVTEELWGWFSRWPFSTRYQESNSTLSLLCQNTHRLTGLSVLAETWYLAVYGNRELKKRTSRHVCVFLCMCDTEKGCVTALQWLTLNPQSLSRQSEEFNIMPEFPIVTLL